MFCKNCGNQLPDGAKFCGACGARLGQEEAPRQQAAPLYQTAPERKPTPKKKSLNGKVIGIALAAVAVVVAVVLLLGLLGGETVYLQTSYVSESETSVYEYTYEYDDEGRLVSYEYSSKYRGDLDFIDPYSLSWEYEYEDGKLVAAEFDDGDVSFELEYVYDKEGNLEAVESDDFEGEVECDKEGRIVEITVEGDLEAYAEYSYFDNGMIEELETQKGSSKNVTVFNEDGKVLESVYYYNEDKNSSDEYEYDEAGNLLSRVYTYYSSGKKSSEYVYTYEYDKKRNLITYVAEFSDSDGELTLACEVVTNGNIQEYNITELSGDREAYAYITDYLDEGDTYREQEYDDHGNLIRSVTNDEYESETEYEYLEFKAPRGYLEPSTDDAIYFMFLD